MKKVLHYGVPVVILVVFVLIMTGGNYLKKPRNINDDVVMYIKVITEDVKGENWNKAEEDTKKLSDAWEKITPRIQFSVQRDEMYNISVNIARLKGIVMGRDRAAAFAELSEMYENWIELTR